MCVSAERKLQLYPDSVQKRAKLSVATTWFWMKWCMVSRTSWTFFVLLDVLSVNPVKDMAVLSFYFKNINLLINESN